jgi:nitrite reductase (NADH) small subunit
MSEQYQERLLGPAADFPPGSRRIAIVDGVEIGVYRRGERFHAYENLCAHQGGPACEGITIGAVEPVLREDRTIAGERFSEREHIVCPWHGYEYELESGTCAHDPRIRLRRFDVVRRGDEVYVLT